ncbi:MAG: hypothetical protein LUD81_10480 [Clostridiales bacterium]|nr:hypothetical protein [Clostridiales bacterium]
MDTPITRAEHNEFCKRLEEENQRQNKRLTACEEATKQIQSLTISIQKLADNMEIMCKTQEAEGKRLAELESRDGEMWRKVVGYVITAVIGIIVGFVFTQLGLS